MSGLTRIAPVEARHVPTERGTRPEPPHDPRWSPAEQLAWHAALVESETGLTIRLSHYSDDPSMFTLTVTGPGSSSGTSGMPFQSAWTYINGISTGALATRAQED